jgi:hypothetical protein
MKARSCCVAVGFKRELTTAVVEAAKAAQAHQLVKREDQPGPMW